MHTGTEDHLWKKAFVTFFGIMFSIILQLCSIRGLMAWLPMESYAGRSMFTLAIVMIIIVGTIITVVNGLNILKKGNMFLIVMIIVILCMVIFLRIAFCYMPSVKAKFAFESYKYFVRFEKDENNNAEDALTEALYLDKQNARYWKENGDLYLQAEDYAKSVYYYNEALKLKPDSDDFLFARGCAYLKNNKLEDAKHDLEIVLKHCPGNAEYNYEVANLYCSLGREDGVVDNYEQAIDYYTNAININPKNENYYNQRVDAYIFLATDEGYLQAIEDLTTLINMQIDNSDYYYRRGKVYIYLSEYSHYQNAIDDLTKAIEIDNDIADYYLWRGKASYYLEDYQEAIDDYSIAITKDIGNAEYYYWKALAYCKQENFMEDLDSICKAIECNGEDPKYHYHLGNLYFNEENYEEAIKEYRICTKLSPDNEYYHFDLGDAYYMIRKYKKAIKEYSEAIKLNSSNILYLSRRSLCYYLVNNKEKMIDDMISIMYAQEHGQEIEIDRYSVQYLKY